MLTPKFQAIIDQDAWAAIDRELTNQHVVKAHTLTNVTGDAGVKIASAIAALPVGVGGTVDATGFPNPQNLTGFTIPPGVTVLLGPIFHTTAGPDPIWIQDGGRLIGAATNSPGATTIKLGNGRHRDVIQCKSRAGESGWWHHGELRNLRILGNKQNNTTGNAVSVFGLGETSLIQRLSISDAAQAGLYIKGSQSGTGTIENVTVNTSALYGVQFDAFRSSILLKSVGGDQNQVTFAITNASQGGGAILLIDPKSEGAVSVDPDPVILISGGSARVTLTIQGGNFLTPNANRTAIRIAPNTPNPCIQIVGLASGNSVTTLIDDQALGVQISADPMTYHSLFMYRAGKVVRFDDAGFFTQG